MQQLPIMYLIGSTRLSLALNQCGVYLYVCKRLHHYLYTIGSAPGFTKVAQSLLCCHSSAGAVCTGTTTLSKIMQCIHQSLHLLTLFSCLHCRHRSHRCHHAPHGLPPLPPRLRLLQTCQLRILHIKFRVQACLRSLHCQLQAGVRQLRPGIQARL